MAAPIPVLEPAAQARIVSLLDGRIERVEVGVKDRRGAQHEHMFAQPDWMQSLSAGVSCAAL